jgi:hypothetical protein
MKLCMDCNEREIDFKGLCLRCYKRRQRREQGIPMKPEKIRACSGCGTVGIITGHGLCEKCYSKWYWRKNLQKSREYIRRYQQKYHFGAHPEVIERRERDGCTHCGISNAEHKATFGRELTVHHIDGMGRTSARPNHDPSNLLILCDRCHTRLHSNERQAAS